MCLKSGILPFFLIKTPYQIESKLIYYPSKRIYAYFCPMLRRLYIILLTGVLIISGLSTMQAQERMTTQPRRAFARQSLYKGDTILWIELRPVYIYKPLKFKNNRQQKSYSRLVRNVKKTLPIAKEIKGIIIQTSLKLDSIPTEKERKKYIKQMEKYLKETYTPRMKKLTFSQGKLLIKLVDRECNQTSYQLVKSFMGSFKAGFYQTFAALFGASLKKEYDPEHVEDDAITERVIVLVENGQL